MSLANWARLMSFVTVTALVYIHVQTQIVDLAYKGKAKERRFHELMDNNGTLTHQILAMKSASYLGQALLEKDEGLKFLGHDRVMTMPGPAATAPAVKIKAKAENPLRELLTFLAPQDAKAWDRDR